MPSEFSLDLDAPTAEGAHDFRRNAVKLGKAIADGPPTDPELGGRPLAKCGLVEAPRGHPVRVDGPRVERGPAAIRPERHIRYDGVCVQLRISRPRRAMAKGRSDEALGRKHPYAVAPPSHPYGAALEIAEGGGHRLVMGAAHRGLDVGGADAEQQAHALRRGERQIDGRIALRTASMTKQFAM